MDKQKEALMILDTICKAMDSEDWKYERIDEELMIKSGARGEDLPIEFFIRVNADNKVVSLLSIMPFRVAEEKRIEGAVAVCSANYGMVDGSFDYDITDGSIIFRLTSSYRDSILSEELFKYMLYVSMGTIDRYNDKFLMVSKGIISIEDFIRSENS